MTDKLHKSCGILAAMGCCVSVRFFWLAACMHAWALAMAPFVLLQAAWPLLYALLCSCKQ